MHNTDNGSESGGDQAPTARTTLPVSAGATAVSVSSAPNTLSSNGNASVVRECAGCGKRIIDRFLLKALDLFWHEDCLKCGCCDCRLGEVGSTLYTKANLILCKRDYLRLFGTTGYCAACNKVIPAFEMVMRAKNNVYHLECFACQQCNHRFCVGDRFYLCENKILCEYDYEERLVFANIAYNPSSLAHIRRQVNNLQPPAVAAGDNLTPLEARIQVNSPSCYSEKNSDMVLVPQRQPINLAGNCPLPLNLHGSCQPPTTSLINNRPPSIANLSGGRPPVPSNLINDRSSLGNNIINGCPPPSASHIDSCPPPNMIHGRPAPITNLFDGRPPDACPPHSGSLMEGCPAAPPMNQMRDDGSSGYGSPDSETFEVLHHQ